MTEAIKQDKQELAYIIFRALDYDRLIVHPPYNSKGEVDQAKYNRQIEKATNIYNKVILGQENKLTESEEKRLIEINKRLLEQNRKKQRGESIKDSWLSTQVR